MDDIDRIAEVCELLAPHRVALVLETAHTLLDLQFSVDTTEDGPY